MKPMNISNRATMIAPIMAPQFLFLGAACLATCSGPISGSALCRGGLLDCFSLYPRQNTRAMMRSIITDRYRPPTRMMLNRKGQDEESVFHHRIGTLLMLKLISLPDWRRWSWSFVMVLSNDIGKMTKMNSVKCIVQATTFHIVRYLAFLLKVNQLRFNSAWKARKIHSKFWLDGRKLYKRGPNLFLKNIWKINWGLLQFTSVFCFI